MHNALQTRAVLFSEAIILSGISVFAYVSTFLYEVGYLQAFNIPSQLVDVSFRAVFNVFGVFLGILFPFFWAIFGVFHLGEKSFNSMIQTFGFFFVPSLGAYVVFDSWGAVNWIACVVLSVGIILIYLLEKNLVPKIKNHSVFYRLYSLIMILLTLVLLVYTFVSAGSNSAIRQQKFLSVDVDGHKYALLRKYDDQNLFVEVKREWIDLYEQEFVFQDRYLITNQNDPHIKLELITASHRRTK